MAGMSPNACTMAKKAPLAPREALAGRVASMAFWGAVRSGR